MTNIFAKIQSGLTYVIVALIPFFFAPVLTDAFDLGKQTVLLAGVLLLMVIMLIQIINSRQLVSAQATGSGYLKFLVLLIVALLLSSLINTPNKLLSLTSINGPATWLILAIFFGFALMANKTNLAYALIAGACIVSLTSLVFTFAPLSFPVKIPLTGVSIGKYFSPAGSLTTQTLFLGALLPLTISLVYQLLKTNRLLKLIPAVLALVIILGGLAASLTGLASQPKGTLLPQNTSWSIALETMKSGRQAILGFGPGQYVNAFTTSKPLSFNATPVWNTRFGSASNWYFQLLTEAGLAGLLITLALVWSTVVKAGRRWQDPAVEPVVHGASLALIILFIGLAVLPGNLVIFFLLIALFAITEKVTIRTKDLGQLGGFIYPLAVFPLALWALLLYFGSRQVLANYYYYQSLVAANTNDGVKTYNLQAKSITADASSPAYRWAYAQTNLALANAIAAQATTEKPLTDEQRNNISQLIQQAINEAKSTVALDPRSAAAWENLAATYRSLINFAEGAEQWSIDSYQQAIALDPLNPRLRLDFGSLYYGQKKYDLAVNLFAQAVNLKADYANAQYNFAITLKELGQYQQSATAYQNTLALVPADSEDAKKVSAELEEIKKLLPSPTPGPTGQPGQTETLTAPANPPQGINPPIQVPEGEPPSSADTN